MRVEASEDYFHFLGSSRIEACERWRPIDSIGYRRSGHVGERALRCAAIADDIDAAALQGRICEPDCAHHDLRLAVAVDIRDCRLVFQRESAGSVPPEQGSIRMVSKYVSAGRADNDVQFAVIDDAKFRHRWARVADVAHIARDRIAMNINAGKFHWKAREAGWIRLDGACDLSGSAHAK